MLSGFPVIIRSAQGKLLTFKICCHEKTVFYLNSDYHPGSLFQLVAWPAAITAKSAWFKPKPAGRQRSTHRYRDGINDRTFYGLWSEKIAGYKEKAGGIIQPDFESGG